MRPRARIVRLSDWQKVKQTHHRGKVVEAKVVRQVGLGALCEVGKKRCPGILRSREVSWNPAEQTRDHVEVGVAFKAVVIGYDEEWRELVLSRKAAEPGPLDKFLRQHPIGAVVEGSVEKILPAGFVLRLEGDVEGFLPKNAIPRPPAHADKRVRGLGELSIGDRVMAVVKQIKRETNWISVDVRQYLEQTEDETARVARELWDNPSVRPSLIEEAGDGTPEAEAEPQPVSKGLTILVLEDNEGILTPVGMTLEGRMHTVLEANSVIAAQTVIARTEKIDVALLDLQLTGESGCPLFAELRGRYPGIRLYAFSGNPDYLDAQHSGEEVPHIDGLILKPVETGELLSYVEGSDSLSPAPRTGWAMDEAIRRFMDGGDDTRSESVSETAGDIMDGHLRSVCDCLPGTRVAVLSFSRERNEVTCLGTTGLDRECFSAYASKLPLTAIGNCLADGVPVLRRVDLISDADDPLVYFLGPIGCSCFLGIPLDVESRPDPLGLFVFGSDDPESIPRENIREAHLIAGALSVALERWYVKMDLVRHQRAICVGSLILGMAHELRNSIQSLESYRAVLEESLVHGRQNHRRPAEEVHQQALGAIGGQVTYLRDSMESFLGIVRAGHSQQGKLAQILWRALDDCRASAAKDSIALNLTIPDDLADVPLSNILHQAFLNLILNAIQHTAASRTKSGLVQLQVTRSTEEGRPYVEVRVSDNAWGVPWADRERVFDMFHTTRLHGSGLGLYVTRLIIRSLDGDVSVEDSHRFVGTTFLVRLPIV